MKFFQNFAAIYSSDKIPIGKLPQKSAISALIFIFLRLIFCNFNFNYRIFFNKVAVEFFKNSCWESWSQMQLALTITSSNWHYKVSLINQMFQFENFFINRKSISAFPRWKHQNWYRFNVHQCALKHISCLLFWLFTMKLLGRIRQFIFVCKKIKKINALIQTKVRLASVQTKSMNNISVNSLKESWKNKLFCQFSFCDNFLE